MMMTKPVTIYKGSAQAIPKAQSKRRHRLERAGADALPPLRLTKRDLAIVNACYEYRALNTPQIQQLFFNHSNTYGQLVQCQHRLKLLYHHGYLYRDEQPTKFREGHRPLIYFLDRKGAQLLSEYLGVEPAALDWHPRSNAAGAGHLFLDHLLKTNDVRIAISLAAAQEQAVIESWLDDKALKSQQMKDYVQLHDIGSDEAPVALVPDGYFCLKLGNRQQHHFLEADMGTVIVAWGNPDRRAWAKKIHTYLKYHEHGQFQQRYQANSFRVLTVTTGERRLTHLKQVTEEAGGKARFWFTTFSQLTPETALSQPIWHIAGREGVYSLLWHE